MPKVIHFEIPAEEPERAVEFYRKVFGWKIDKWAGEFDYWLVEAGEEDEPGINGAIKPKEFGSMISDVISIDSYDEFARKIEAEGGQMLTEKMTIPDMGYTGSFQDTEGNVMGIIEVTLLFIIRTFPASLEKVWEAWTDPETIKKWWGPRGYTAPVVKNDFRVGGSSLYSMRSPEGQDIWSTGVYKDIVPRERIVSTDSFADAEGNVVPASYYGMSGDWPLELMVTVIFQEEDGKTRLTLQHTGFPDNENKTLAEAGWNESLDKLAEYLAKV
ncbi:SRPBCC domain-containing protein [Methanobacterium formicicum]|uniref:Activator of Hsp90 ATPase 1 family protein n=1 Tax=Methanobacterium formicicum TaxID=2162 RepID=A0A0S4FND5_METFO|nr:SRPBCC domain-containing protein [Methanobacterium formicicum]CEL24527.1 Activator of Hsp90 ATPase 1 family protein [Methanobacterium formicicum]